MRTKEEQEQFRNALRLRSEYETKAVPKSAWRHHRSNDLYYIERVALLESDLSVVVVYRSPLSNVSWVRPVAEFLDGRFKRSTNEDEFWKDKSH